MIAAKARKGGAGLPLSPTFAEAVGVWAQIGLLSFGGPAGQIATMHRILVEQRKWVSETRFLHALNFCMLLPGPEAQQLATYLGWVLHRVPGGLVAGALFVLPGLVVMMGLSGLYVGFHHVPAMEGLFFGLKPAVLAVVVDAVLRIGRRTLKHKVLRGIAVAAFLAIFLLDVPFPLIILAAGLAGYFAASGGHSAFLPSAPTDGGRIDAVLESGGGHTRPEPMRLAALALCCLVAWLAPVGLALWWGQGAFGAIGVFFAKMAVVTFGGAYAVLAYVAQQAVEVQGWLAPGEMLDGLGLAETTPGPLILVNQFVGFLAGFRHPGPLSPWLGGVLGAGLTVWATFLPTYLWVFVGGPFVEAARGHVGLAGALKAITAAVVGVIVNLSVWFARHVRFLRITSPHLGPLRLLLPDWGSVDPLAAALALMSLVAMLRFRLGMLPTLAAAAGTGLVWRLIFG